MKELLCSEDMEVVNVTHSLKRFGGKEEKIEMAAGGEVQKLYKHLKTDVRKTS